MVELEPLAPDEDEPPVEPDVVPVLAPGVPPASAVVVELEPLAPDEDEPPVEPAVVSEPEPLVAAEDEPLVVSVVDVELKVVEPPLIMFDEPAEEAPDPPPINAPAALAAALAGAGLISKVPFTYVML